MIFKTNGTLNDETLTCLYELAEVSLVSFKANEITDSVAMYFQTEKSEPIALTVKKVADAIDSCFYAYMDFVPKVSEKYKRDCYIDLRLQNAYEQMLFKAFFKVTHITHFLVAGIPFRSKKSLLNELKLLAAEYTDKSFRSTNVPLQQQSDNFFNTFLIRNLSQYCIDDYIFIMFNAIIDRFDLIQVIIDFVYPRFKTKLEKYLNDSFKTDSMLNIHTRLHVENCIAESLYNIVKDRIERFSKSTLWYTERKYKIKYANEATDSFFTFSEVSLSFSAAEKILLGEEYVELIDDIQIMLKKLREEKQSVIDIFKYMHKNLLKRLQMAYGASASKKYRLLSESALHKKVFTESLALVRVFDKKLIRQICQEE